MWVLRRIPTEKDGMGWLSPWQGYLFIDQDNKAWYATNLAKPTQFISLLEAEKCAEIVRRHFPESEIQVAVYEEVFQELPPIPTTQPITTVKDTTGIPDWNWNDEQECYEIPF